MRHAWAPWSLILVVAGWSPAAAEPLALSVPTDVGGKAVPVDVRLQAASGGEWTGWRAEIDLVPLLAEGRVMLRRQLPRDPCAKRGSDNWVVYLEAFAARVERDRLRLRLEFDVEWWACLELWRSDLRRRLSRGRVRMELAFGVESAAEGVRLWAEPPQIRTDGDLGRAARLWFAARGEDWNERLIERFERWNEDLPVFALPALGPFAGRLVGARFLDSGGPVLTLETQLEWRPPLWLPKVFGGR